MCVYIQTHRHSHTKINFLQKNGELDKWKDFFEKVLERWNNRKYEKKTKKGVTSTMETQECHRKCQHAKVSEVSTFSNNEVICNVGSSSYYKE